MADKDTEKEHEQQATLFTARNILLILLLVAGIIFLVLRQNGSDSPVPSPTPVRENVDRIAP